MTYKKFSHFSALSVCIQEGVLTISGLYELGDLVKGGSATHDHHQNGIRTNPGQVKCHLTEYLNR